MIINVIKDKEFWEQLLNASEEINEFLYHYCGPFANNIDMKQIIADAAQLADEKLNLMDRFTKDGIGIISALSVNNPIQKMYLRWLTHIGRLVDSACHDGTTTAMLSFGNVVKHIASVMSKNLEDDSNLKNERNRVQFVKVLQAVIVDLLQVIENHKWTRDKVKEALTQEGVKFTHKELTYGIVFHQALLSSKGDVKLADKLGEYLSCYPDDLNGKMNLGNTRLETPEPYYLIERKGDYTFECASILPLFINNKKDYAVDYQDCDLITVTGGFLHNNPLVNIICAAMLADERVRSAFLFINSPNFHPENVVNDPVYQLSSYNLTESFINPEKPFIVLGMEGIIGEHPVFPTLCAAYQAAHKNSPVIPVQCTVRPELVSITVRGFMASAGKLPFDEVLGNHEMEKAIIHGVDFYSRFNEAIIEKVYAEREDDVNLYYLDKTKNPRYTAILEEIKQKINEAQKDHLKSKRENDNIPKYTDLYRQMTHAHLKDLRLGGMTYDLVANDHVAEDASGSSMSSLFEGFVFTGYCKLAEWCQRMAMFEEQGSYAYEAYHIFKKAFLETLQAIYRSPIEHIENLLQYMSHPQIYLRCDPLLHLPSTTPDQHRMQNMIDRFANIEVDKIEEGKDTKEEFENIVEEIEKKSEIDSQEFWEKVCVGVDFKRFLIPAQLKKEALAQGKDPITVLKDIDPIPLQPVAGYTQGLLRYKSLLPHLVNTNAYIHTEER